MIGYIQYICTRTWDGICSVASWIWDGICFVASGVIDFLPDIVDFVIVILSAFGSSDD